MSIPSIGCWEYSGGLADSGPWSCWSCCCWWWWWWWSASDEDSGSLLLLSDIATQSWQLRTNLQIHITR